MSELSGLIEVTGAVTLPEAAPGINMVIALATDYTDLKNSFAGNIYTLGSETLFPIRTHC